MKKQKSAQKSAHAPAFRLTKGEIDKLKLLKQAFERVHHQRATIKADTLNHELDAATAAYSENPTDDAFVRLKRAAVDQYLFREAVAPIIKQRMSSAAESVRVRIGRLLNESLARARAEAAKDFDRISAEDQRAVQEQFGAPLACDSTGMKAARAKLGCLEEACELLSADAVVIGTASLHQLFKLLDRLIETEEISDNSPREGEKTAGSNGSNGS